jgi:hypothetical protein
LRSSRHGGIESRRISGMEKSRLFFCGAAALLAAFSDDASLEIRAKALHAAGAADGSGFA